MARAGRRPGPTSSSAEVLASARTLFAERGYRATTVRAIAAAAGVTPAMVHHFFGSKQQVFLASIRMPIDPAEVLGTLLSGPHEQFAERFVATFVGYWSDEQTGPALRTMLRSALTDDEHAGALRAFASGVLLPRAATGLGVPVENVAAAFTTLIGLAVGRYLLGIAQLVHLSDEQVIARYVPIVGQALAR